MTIPTIFIYRGLEYGLYDYFCKNQTEGFYSTPQGKFIMAYIISNSITTLLYPFTTLRVRRIMTTGESTQYKSWLEIYKYVVATEGHKGLFRGMSANLIKNIGTSCVISFYDILSEQARRLNTDKFS